jgi:hypothetical protein
MTSIRHLALLALLVPGPLAAADYGPDLEPCTQAGVAVEPGDGWRERLEGARPGETILLRGGTYALAGSLRLPSGTPGQPILIKPYDCEAVKLRPMAHAPGIGDALTAGSHVTVASLDIESASHESLLKVRNARDLELRHNRLAGGRNDAFVVSGGEDLRFIGNAINSGPGQRTGITESSGGHLFYLKASDDGRGPRGVQIAGNHIEGSYFGDLVSGDDVFAVQAGDDVVIENNLITAQYNIENIIDIKTSGSSTPVVFRANRAADNFKGTKGGQDHHRPEACLVVGDSRSGPALRHLIADNLFDGCPGGFFSIGGGERTGSALITGNLFRDAAEAGEPVAGVIARAVDTEVAHNVFYRGALQLGRGYGCSKTQMPQGLVIRDNIFDGTSIVDRTEDCPEVGYRLEHNLFHRLPSGFKRRIARGNRELDPRFRDPGAGDFSLQAGSPAIGAATDGRNLGPAAEPPDAGLHWTQPDMRSR